ncbi:Bifunctional purine biosynthesis protein PurH [Microbotryomycetes sp. JL221]|nr:Bifunctional purine biosynthesis protein PurH [Microbotryomycetes sp. JL221]
MSASQSAKFSFRLGWVVAGAFEFGVITSAYTVGGLVSSLYTGKIADARGRKATAQMSAWLVVMIVSSPLMVETKEKGDRPTRIFDVAEDEERAPLARDDTVNPSNAKAVAVFVTVVNFVMTLPAVYLVDRVGRRSLLLFSLTTMSISSLVLAYSINHSKFLLAATFIVLFVATFSVGLGPVPFVLTGELAPPASRSATASVALAVNWLSNLLVGLTFLPLRDWLAGGRSDASGTIFYVFAVMSAVGCVTMAKRLSA